MMKSLPVVVLLLLVAASCVAQPMWIERPVLPEPMDWYAQQADLNGNGWLDIFTPTQGSDSLVWLENVPGELAFVRHPIAAQREDDRYTYGDLDGDGDVDLVSIDDGLDTLRMFENSGDGSGWTEHEVPVNDWGGAGKIVLADVDNDGYLDILYSRALDEYGVIWLDYNGDLYAMTSQQIQTNYQFHSTSELLCVDLDGDADLDIVVSHDASYNGFLHWIENSDSGQTWTEHEIIGTAGASSIAAEDFNGDGMIDLACASQHDGLTVLYAVVPGGPWNFNQINTNYDYFDLAVADIDQDGDLDFATARTRGTVWWENRPDQGWRYHYVYGGELNISRHQILCADFTGDEWPELVVSGQRRFYDNNLANVDYAFTMEERFSYNVYIEPNGGYVPVRWSAWNRTAEDATLDVWGEAWYEDGTLEAQHVFYSDVLLPAGWKRGEPRYLPVSGDWPVGEYKLVANLGTYPNYVAAADTITIYRVPYGAFTTDASGSEAISIPTSAGLVLNAYPNPFNTMGTVTLTLPEADQVRVTVHNMLGQTVATLADGSFNAGTQEFVLDGSALASGVYFVRADVAGEAPLMQKVVLLK